MLLERHVSLVGSWLFQEKCQPVVHAVLGRMSIDIRECRPRFLWPNAHVQTRSLPRILKGKSMSLLKRRISWSTNFIRQFGFYHGLRLLFAIEQDFPSTSEEIKRLVVPGYDQPFFLRRTIADHATFKQCLVMQQYDFHIFPQSKRLIDDYQAALSRGETPLIIDCGGNVGFATRWFAREFPESRVVVIEPDDQNFLVLTMNTEHLGDRVKRLKGGIWNTPARLRITNPNAGSAAFRVEELDVSEGEGLRAYTIDEICEMEGVGAPFIVKLDIEGAQSTLFKTNTDWVPKTHLITLELDDWLMPWQGTSRRFFSCVSRYPFEYLFRDESIYCFRDFDSTSSN
jgi:FkbM family methyltransferase